MILHNQNQKWEKKDVALCHVWNCDRIIRLDQAHQYVKPEWFGSPWHEGLDRVAICSYHVIGKGEKFEVAPSRPPDFEVKGWDMSGLQEFATKLAETGGGFIAMGDNKTGEWHQVQPEPVQHFTEEELKKLDTFDVKPEDFSATRDFVFTHEVTGEHDYIYKEYDWVRQYEL